MTARTRLWVLVVSTPVIAFTLIGGYLGQAMTRDETLRNLRVFEDVMQLVVDNYVEDVDVSEDAALAVLLDLLPFHVILQPFHFQQRRDRLDVVAEEVQVDVRTLADVPGSSPKKVVSIQVRLHSLVVASVG